MEDISFRGRKHSGSRKRGLIIIGLMVVVVAVFVVKQQRHVLAPSQESMENRPEGSDRSEQITAGNPGLSGQPKPTVLPRLLDLGADKCVPCKMMAPILEQLKEEYKGRFKVDVIDVWKDPAASRSWRIRVIPTQIFFDGSGKELYRHEGFFSKEDILKKWKDLGVDVERSGRLP